MIYHDAHCKESVKLLCCDDPCCRAGKGAVFCYTDKHLHFQVIADHKIRQDRKVVSGKRQFAGYCHISSGSLLPRLRVPAIGKMPMIDRTVGDDVTRLRV